MTTPIRLRLSRLKGFDLQEHSRATNGLPAVRVARPGKFGNPFTLEDAVYVHDCGRESAHHYAVGWFREWLTQPADHHDQTEMGAYGYLREHRAKVLAGLPSLRGKNLACFCKPGFACHADVLLELANRPVCEAPDRSSYGGGGVMGDLPETAIVTVGVWPTWRKTGNLRWVRPSTTTTKPDRLQEEWQEVNRGGREWRDVPLVIEDEPVSSPYCGEVAVLSSVGGGGE